MFKTGETCQITGTYRYAGHTGNINGCHRKWDENDIRMEKGKKLLLEESVALSRLCESPN